MNNANKEKYDALTKQLVEYMGSKQWDLAKTSIEQLLGMESSAELDDEEKRTLYLRASKVYLELKLYDQSIEMCNKAIVLSPDHPNCYVNKIIAAFSMIEDKLNNNQGEIDSQVELARINCNTMLEKAKQVDDKECITWALGNLSYSYSVHEPTDYETARSLAEEALTYDANYEYAKQRIQFLSGPIEINQTQFKSAFDGYNEETCNLTEEINQSVEKLIELLKFTREDAAVTLKNMRTSYEEGEEGDEYLYTHDYSIVLNSRGVYTLYEVSEDIYKPALIRFPGAPRESKKTEKVLCRYPDVLNDLLVEFDFEGRIHYEDYTYNKFINNDNYIHNLITYIETLNSLGGLDRMKVRRLYLKKGQGLLETVKKAIIEQEKAVAEEKGRRKKEEEKANYRSQNRCQYCGGTFKGLFTKRCASCGREKDY